MLLPSPPSDAAERCRLSARAEVLSYLRQAVERRATVAAFFGGGNDRFATTLLSVNPQFEELVFDCSGDPEANAAILRSGRITFVTVIDDVKVQFDTQRAEATVFDGLPAYRTRIPSSLLRLQFREFFRVAPPLSRPLACRLPDPRQRGAVLELRVLDISAGGLALLLPCELPLEVGDRIPECRVALTEVGEIVFEAEVRSLLSYTGPGAGDGAWRCGLRFVALPGTQTALVQRYVMKLQRERIASR